MHNGCLNGDILDAEGGVAQLLFVTPLPVC